MELKGKTISHFADGGVGEVFLGFTDGTCVFMQPTMNYDMPIITMLETAPDYMLLDAGLIDDDEYSRRLNILIEQQTANRIERERAEYERLRAKFDPR